LLQGGPNVTNNVFPVHILLQDGTTHPHFIHNILNLYLVLPAAIIFGSFKGWIVTNIVATILTASLLALIITKVANRWLAVLAYSVYLLLPLTIWQTSQPLAEATIAPFIAIGMLIYIRADRNEFMWGLLVIVACLLYYCRTSFLPILLVVPIAYFIQNRACKTKNLLYAFGLLSFVVLVIMTKRIIFPEDAVSLRKIINSGVPGVSSNMFSFFSISPEPILLSNICSKIMRNLSLQVLSKHWHAQIFRMPFNVLTAFSLYFFFFVKKSKVQLRIAHCGITLLFLHILTIILHQNQFRYLLMATPAILVCSALVINRVKFFQSKRAQLGLVLVVVFCLIVGSTAPAIRLHRQGLQKKELRMTLNSIFDSTIPKDQSLMVDASDSSNLILGYVLRPRTVIFTRTGYTNENYQAMLERGNPKWLLCPIESPLVEQFNISSQPVLKNFPSPYNDYGLFQF